jgi:hypothetical protein
MSDRDPVSSGNHCYRPSRRLSKPRRGSGCSVAASWARGSIRPSTFSVDRCRDCSARSRSPRTAARISSIWLSSFTRRCFDPTPAVPPSRRPRSGGDHREAARVRAEARGTPHPRARTPRPGQALTPLAGRAYTRSPTGRRRASRARRPQPARPPEGLVRAQVQRPPRAVGQPREPRPARPPPRPPARRHARSGRRGGRGMARRQAPAPVFDDARVASRSRSLHTIASMVAATAPRVRSVIWRVWAAPGRPRPRAASSRPETDVSVASTIEWTSAAATSSTASRRRFSASSACASSSTWRHRSRPGSTTPACHEPRCGNS